MANHVGGWASTQYYVGHHSTQSHRCGCEDVIIKYKAPGYVDGYHDIKCNDLHAMQSAVEPQQYLSGQSVVQFSRGALRRHRRKLARIVIDHWLYKSRKRLLLLRLQKIQQKVLKSFYFREWRGFMTTRVEKRDKLKKALQFRELSIKKQTFYEWNALFKIELKRERIFEQLFKLVKARKCRLILCAWYEHSLQRFQQQRLVLKAEQFRNLTLLSTCFENWQIRVQGKQYATYLRKLALGFWAHKRLSFAWQAMKSSVKIRHTALELMNKRKQRIMSSTLQCWCQLTRKEWQEMQKCAVCFHKNSMLQKSVMGMQIHNKWSKDLKLRKAKALTYWSRKCVYQAFETWHEYSTGEHDRKRKAALAQIYFENKLLRSAFNRWCQYTRAQIKRKEENATTWFKKKLCSRCIHDWKKLLPQSTKRYRKILDHQSQKQNISKLLQNVEFLRSQNRLLLRHKCLFLDRITWRRLLRRTGIRSIAVAQAQAFYKACFQELKQSVRKDLRRLKKQESALNKQPSLCLQTATTCMSNVKDNDFPSKVNPDVSTDTHCEVSAPVMASSSTQEGLCKSMMVITSPVDCSELKMNSSEGQVFPRLVSYKKEKQRCSSSNKETRETSLGGRIFRRFRLPPRRPPYLMDETDVHAKLQRANVADTAMQRTDMVLCPGVLASKVLKQTKEVTPASVDGNVSKTNLLTGLLSCASKSQNGNAAGSTLKSYLYEPDIVTEELLWTEGQLSSFSNLKGEIEQKITELSALDNKYKSDEQFKANHVGNLENTMMILQQRRAFLLPIIQSLATRATELRELRSNKRNQALHLD